MVKKQTLRIVLAVIMAASIAYSQQPQPAGAGAARYNTSGERVIDFFDIHSADIRSVLRQLSAYSGLDMVCSDAVKATVSISVTNKSWREILSLVCMVYNLTFMEDPKFIYVMTTDEAVARGVGGGGETGTPLAPIGAGADAMEARGPLTREVVQLRYTKAKEMSGVLTPFLSQRGKLNAVDHTNSLILVDTDENLKQLRHLIGQIDIQTPQISISCKMVVVSSGAVQNMGVNWGYTDANNNVTVGQFWPENPPLFNPLQHTVTYGLLDPVKFQATLSYLLEDNKAEVVAQPQITTLNNKEAKIFMGQQIQINTKDEANNTISQLVNIGTQLTVTPYVSGDGKIMLTLNPSKESLSGISLTDGSPVIDQQSAMTNVLVSNGETVVIAGLTSNEKLEGESGIPILKNIPILGHLFKKSTKSAQKKDLVIFVTPHIIHSEM